MRILIGLGEQRDGVYYYKTMSPSQVNAVDARIGALGIHLMKCYPFFLQVAKVKFVKFAFGQNRLVPVDEDGKLTVAKAIEEAEGFLMERAITVAESLLCEF